MIQGFYEGVDGDLENIQRLLLFEYVFWVLGFLIIA